MSDQEIISITLGGVRYNIKKAVYYLQLFSERTFNRIMRANEDIKSGKRADREEYKIVVEAASRVLNAEVPGFEIEIKIEYRINDEAAEICARFFVDEYADIIYFIHDGQIFDSEDLVTREICTLDKAVAKGLEIDDGYDEEACSVRMTVPGNIMRELRDVVLPSAAKGGK